MGWYSAVGRTTMFTLPPESAHRLAGLVLSLPLPWARIGGASTDPSLAVTVAGIPLQNPVGLAAGFDKTGAHVDALGALGFGYVVAGTFTQEPREGNARPRIARFSRKRSMVNAMGLPNPGADRAAATLGGVWNIAGPIFGAHPRTIGHTRVAVPAASWMIVVRGNRAIAVIIPNVRSYSGAHQWQDFIVPVAEVEHRSGIRINLPAGIAHNAQEPAWPVDHGPWTVEHQAACRAVR